MKYWDLSADDIGNAFTLSPIVLKNELPQNDITMKSTKLRLSKKSTHKTTKKRLPPGQVLTKKWPILDLGEQPSISTSDWSLSVEGLVRNPIIWNWSDFYAQPQIECVSDIHCVTTWSRLDNHWQGVSAKHFLSVVQPEPSATRPTFRWSILIVMMCY